jgi:hypothetical protein
MEFLTTIGTAAACCGALFFLICAGLVFWYLFNQPKKAVASDDAPEQPVSAAVESSPAETAWSDDAPGVDV